jgi:hypothetical protein
MRKSVTIAILAFLAGAASTWTLSHTGANPRYSLSGGAESSINTLDLTMKAGVMPSQSFDAH